MILLVAGIALGAIYGAVRYFAAVCPFCGERKHVGWTTCPSCNREYHE